MIFTCGNVAVAACDTPGCEVMALVPISWVWKAVREAGYDSPQQGIEYCDFCKRRLMSREAKRKGSVGEV